MSVLTGMALQNEPTDYFPMAGMNIWLLEKQINSGKRRKPGLTVEDQLGRSLLIPSMSAKLKSHDWLNIIYHNLQHRRINYNTITITSN